MSGIKDMVTELCQSGNVLLVRGSQPPTVYQTLNAQMCLLINFMCEAFDRRSAAFMPELLSTLGPAVVLPTIEMRRSGYRSSVTLLSMLLLGALYQNYSGAVVLPLWWAVHLAFSTRHYVPLHPHFAEATFLGYLLGYLIVSVAMTVYQTSATVGVWQLFPVCVFSIQALYLWYQRNNTEDVPDCPYEVLQLIHVTNFCWSAVTHAYTLFQALSSPNPLEALKHSFYPRFSPASLALFPTTAQQFLKWDILFIAGATLVAGISLLRGARSKLLAFGWFILGSTFFGMGAGLSGIWMWREKVLEEDRRASVAKLKEE
ncbi:exonuclease [Ceratobasidium sp. AG-Ba]|nr:exonuclease [Ceratobasidium sp. AG-Ba]